MDALGISKAQAIGHLHLLWWWCVDYAPDGVMKHNDSQIARAGEWTGDPVQFVEAVVAAGFLDRGDGVLTVHDWLDFCGPLIIKRIERKQERQTLSAERQTKIAESVPTVPNRTKPNTTKPKDIAPKDVAVRPATPHVAFVEGFKLVYQEVTGSPFKIDQKHWVIAASLVKAHGSDECVRKAKTLGVLCRDRSTWFTKDGFASFTLETLSSKWNNIIPEAVPPTKEQELLSEMKKQEELRARADELIANGSRKIAHR